jgi:hypothetical protein
MTYDNLRRWTMPDHYFGATWPDYYSAGVGQSRDSDALERSNFACMLRELGGESETVIVVEESHWAVGWVQWIALHETDAAALAVADRIKGKLEDYPVVDEEHFSDLEWNEAADFWDSLTPRGKVQEAMHVRESYPWLANEPVWHLGRLDYAELANYGSTISEALCERIRCG